MIRWDSALPPVFMDFETQSTADLKAVGGRLYAADASTRILSLVVLIDGVVYVWVPSGLFRNPANAEVPLEWPAGHKLRLSESWCTPELPEPIYEAVEQRRLFVGHNVLNFDRFIWRHLVDAPEPDWADTILLARTAGLPGDLDSLATTQVGQGKDEAKRLLRKLMHRDEKNEYLDGHIGTLAGVIRYNIGDVLLLESLWESFNNLQIESDVIQVHDTINERGIRVDADLLNKISRVAAVSVGHAGEEISRLTQGELGLHNLRSTQQVHKWLNTHGVHIKRFDAEADGWKASLRKDAVEQALANPWLMLEDDGVSVEAVKNIPPEVFDVLRLRATAMRITEAKTGRAMTRLSPDNRIRDLFNYWIAITGRFGSSGFQIHNLPRPKRGIDPAKIIGLLQSDTANQDVKCFNAETTYELIRQSLPGGLSVDDALSACLRPLFIPAKGHVFAIADYAAIECRATAWLAGETKLLDSLANGDDVYCEFASKLAGFTVTAEHGDWRFMGKTAILGLGYGMGADKFRLFCGLNGVDLQKFGLTAESVVEQYRGTYRKICGEHYSGSIEGMTYRRGGLWDKLNAAMFDVVSGRQRTVEVSKVVYSLDTQRSLVCTLPSGRRLAYRNARIEDRIPKYAKQKGIDRPKATLIYDGPRGEGYLYGGKACENISQAVSRDLLCHAMCRLENDCGINVVAHVHDEIVCEVSADSGEWALNKLCEVMTEVPSWAEGFPISVEGYLSPRYYKKPLEGWLHASRSSDNRTVSVLCASG